MCYLEYQILYNQFECLIITKLTNDLPRGLLYIDLTYNELQNFPQGLRIFTDDIDDVKYTLKINHNPFIRKDKSLQKYETFIKDRSNTDMNHDFKEMIDKYPYFKSKLVTRQINKKGFDGLGNILEEYSRPRTQKNYNSHSNSNSNTTSQNTKKKKKT